MRRSAQIKSRYWIGGTGEKILENCSDTAVILSFYLMTNPHAHMSGIYPLRLELISMDMQKPVARIKTALTELEKIGFCKYDHEAKVVWVVNMAKHQVQFGNPKRVNGVLQQLEGLPNSELIFAFQQYYQIDNKLPKDCQNNGKQLVPIPSHPSTSPSSGEGLAEFAEKSGGTK